MVRGRKFESQEFWRCGRIAVLFWHQFKPIVKSNQRLRGINVKHGIGKIQGIENDSSVARELNCYHVWKGGMQSEKVFKRWPESWKSRNSQVPMVWWWQLSQFFKKWVGPLFLIFFAQLIFCGVHLMEISLINTIVRQAQREYWMYWENLGRSVHQGVHL